MEERKMEEIPSFYVIAYDKIASYASRDMEISTYDAKKAIGYAYRLPKNFLIVMLKELENYNLIEWINRDLIKLKEKPKQLTRNHYNNIERYEMSIKVEA